MKNQICVSILGLALLSNWSFAGTIKDDGTRIDSSKSDTPIHFLMKAFEPMVQKEAAGAVPIQIYFNAFLDLRTGEHRFSQPAFTINYALPGDFLRYLSAFPFATQTQLILEKRAYQISTGSSPQELPVSANTLRPLQLKIDFAAIEATRKNLGYNMGNGPLGNVYKIYILTEDMLRFQVRTKNAESVGDGHANPEVFSRVENAIGTSARGASIILVYGDVSGEILPGGDPYLPDYKATQCYFTISAENQDLLTHGCFEWTTKMKDR